jgi:uncharacterized RDD family membrane protein YckC
MDGRGWDGPTVACVAPATDETPAPSSRDGDAAPVVTATFGRRLAAFVVDWVLSALITYNVLPFDLYLGEGPLPRMLLGLPESSWAVLGVFALLNLVLVSLMGSTLGHRLLGLQVWQVRRGFFPVQVLIRTLLACLFVPGLVVGKDGRGLHDLAAGTRLVLLPR